LGVIKISKKLVLEFFQTYSEILDCNPRELYKQYVGWAKKQHRRRVGFRRFLFMLNRYVEEESIKTSESIKISKS
jgi:hypothetical protein